MTSAIVAAVVASGCLVAAPAAADRWKQNFSRGGGGGGGHNWYHGGYYYPHYNYGYNFWGPALGFGAGAFFGYVLSQPYYYAPRYAPRYAPVYGSDAYCKAKYRSYNSNTGTYTGYDGRQHRCGSARYGSPAGYVPSRGAYGGNGPSFDFRCTEAIAQHGENSAEARTHC
jgi:hypothetical protein